MFCSVWWSAEAKCCGDVTLLELASDIQVAIQFRIQSFLYRQQPTFRINSASVCLPAQFVFTPIQCVRNFFGQLYLVYETSKINR